MTHNDRQAVREMYQSRKSVLYIATRLHIPLAQVQAYIAEAGLKREPAGQGRGAVELHRAKTE